MKIALISARRDPFISPVDMDGGCVMLRNFIRELYDLGHDIHVFTRLEVEDARNSKLMNLKAKAQAKSGVGKVRIRNRLYSYRIPYEHFECSDTNDICQIEESKSFAKNLEEYFLNDSFDVYHYFHLFSISGLLLNKGNIPFFDKTFFSPLLPTQGRSFEYPTKTRLLLEKSVCRKVQTIICLSQREVDILKDGYGIKENKLFKIPLGISSSIFYPKPFNTLQSHNGVNVLISPNAIRDQKRQIEACKIAKYLKDKCIPCTTVLVGRVQDQKYYRKLISCTKSLGLSHKSIKYPLDRKKINECGVDILFVDGVHQKDLAELIRQADLSLFPSKDETFGLILLECMACGTPPVCFNLEAYVDYLIPGENSIAVKKERGWRGLAKEVEKIILHRDTLMTISKIGTNMAPQFSWKNLVNRQVNIYSDIVDKVDRKNHIRYYTASWVNLHK